MVEREHVIGRFRLQPGRQLLADGVPVQLGVKTLAILTCLVEAASDLVTKDELLERVWPGQTIEEHAIQVHVSVLRKALGSDASWIVTVPRRGYRFAGKVGGAKTGAGGTSTGEQGLPRPTTRLHGRLADLSAIRLLLAESGLVTIIGAGGVGKTRLAIEIAHGAVPEYRDGVVFVDLAVLGEAGLVPTAVATALGISLGSNEATVDLITRQLKSRSVLMVLDNCEHLVDAAAELAQTLSVALPNLRVLATSREALSCAGEQSTTSHRSFRRPSSRAASTRRSRTQPLRCWSTACTPPTLDSR